MVESRFHEPEVLRFAEHLSLAKRPSDLLRAEAILSKDSWGIDAMVSLPFYEESSHFPLFVAPSSLPRQYVVPYLCHPYVYFVNHEPLVRPWLKMGYIIIFDTNFASYVDKVVRGEPLKSQQDEVMRVIDDILYNDLNFDPTFYLVENIKKAYPIALGMKDNEINSPHRFWDLLDEGFRQNIVSLQLFRDVDYLHYRKLRKLKFNISYEEAVTRSINLTHKFYASSEGQELVSLFLFLEKVILHQLLGILKIQFSSRRGAKNKTVEFLEFVQKEGLYFEREAIVAHKYFQDSKTIRILESVNRGMQTDLWGKIDNLAWDMTAPRFMERMIAMEAEADFIIPFFLTFDRNLRELIRCYPVKAVIIDRRSGGVLSIPGVRTRDYFMRAGCWNRISGFFSDEKRIERKAKEVPTLEILSERINSLYEELNAILSFAPKDSTKDTA